MLTALIAVACLARAIHFGDPIAHVDEEFYLLVGDRMLHGAVPYVDIWDRKPYGLFLIYATIRQLGGDGVIQYQLVAAACALATIAIVALWTERMAGAVAGFAAGLLYLAMLHKFSGWGGEAEVFLNLVHAAAAWLTWRAVEGRADARVLTRFGALAMACAGIAIEIKTTAVFPAFFFGCALLWAASQARLPAAAIMSRGAMWIALALAPTIAVVSGYAWAGHLDALLFATVGSVGARGIDAELGQRMLSQITNIGLIVATGVGLLIARRSSWMTSQRGLVVFLLLWLASCLAAFASVGAFYNNYALIVAPAAAIVVGRGAAVRGAGIAGLVVVGGFAAFVAIREYRYAQRAPAEIASYERMVRTIRANLTGGCLFVYRGYPAYYHSSGACIPTRFAFPNHLSMATEAHALGIDTVAETRRILATRPPLIIYAPFPANNNRATDAMVRAELAMHYRPIAIDGPHTLYRRRPQRHVAGA